jgi:hypothetical protein
MNKSRVGINLILLLLIGIFSACEEEIDSPPSLLTEEVLYVSGDQARFLGRIITTQNIGATDHGFYISEDEGFSQPLIVSLGARDRPGRFIGEIGELKIAENYFVKAFIEVNSEVQFGNTLSLNTLDPTIFEFSPTHGPGGQIIYITGKNFTSDTQVFFGEREAEVLEISFESRISVRVPAIADSPAVNLKVISQGKEMTFALIYEYTIGEYNKIGNFSFPERLLDNIYFQQEDRFYVGLGSDRGLEFVPKIWEYDLGSNVWQETNFPGRPLSMAFSSSTYFGAGASVLGRSPFVLARDFWKFENGTYQKLPDLPFEEANAVGFEINSNLYVAGGIIGDSVSVLRHNPTTGNWMKLRNAPFPINNSVINFTYENKQYFIDPSNRQLHSFDPIVDNWQVVSTYPGEFGSGGGFGVAIGDRVYIGLANRSQQVWELNMNNLNWVRKNEYPGSPIARNAGVYTHNGLIYFLRSPEIQISSPMEFWSFDPNGF